MAGKFNISQLLSGASLQAGQDGAAAADGREAAPRPMLKALPIDIGDLEPSKDNFYSAGSIAELKNSIEMFGVLQNLVVRPAEGGKFEIIAGHRRRLACLELVAEGKPEYAHVPCVVRAERDELKERILLIMTNSTARELSDWEKMKQAEELHGHFAALKKRDGLPGRVRDLVAEALSASATQVARLSAISHNLLPELAEQFRAGNIGVSAAYELSGLCEAAQREAAAELREKGGLSLSDVRERKQEAAPRGAGSADAADAAGIGDAADAELYREIARIEREEERARQDFKNAGEKAPAAPKEQARTEQPRTEQPHDEQPRTEPPRTEQPRTEPREYPETPAGFEEGQEDGEGREGTEGAKDKPKKWPKNRDFADLSAKEKANAAYTFLSFKRFALFAPGEDTRILDYILEVLEQAPV
ncbi:MAG: ParB N-terminal domain-containing protein [Clostridiales bacterium]|jgi:ParB family chromosome partitioning protein|nr:ParB N-terminal domain-containing protein [Clostridiales bacterium]